jgi:hypothetical protein
MFMDQSNVVGIVTLPKPICRFNAIPFKISVILFTGLWKKYFKIHIAPDKIEKPKQILSKNKDRDITVPDFKLYYKATEIKTVLYIYEALRSIPSTTKKYCTGIKSDT